MNLPLTQAHDGAAINDSPSFDFRALFSSSPNPYVLLDRDFRLVWMNDAYLGVTMRRQEDIIGQRMFEAFPSAEGSESRRLLENSLVRTLESGEADEIALIRYDIAAPDGTMETRYWSATHTPLLDPQGRVTHILQHTVDVTELHTLRTLRDEMGVMQRAEAVQTRNLDLTEQTRRMKGLFEQAPGFVAILMPPDWRYVLANRAYRELVRKHDLVGQPLAEVLPEVVEQGFQDLLDEVVATGRPIVFSREKIFLSGGEGSDADGRQVYLNFIFQPIFDRHRSVTGVFLQGYDVTEEVAAEERQTLMINELNHRVKNTLAVVQGLATQSFRQLPGSAEARLSFDARLNALAAAHNLLTERAWESSRLADTVRAAIDATAGPGEGRFEIDGPDIELQPQTAVSLSMVLHELGTNAIKYGALSQDGGRIAVHWTLEPENGQCRLVIDWRETGGPPVEPPQQRGFGSKLIQRGMSGSPGSGAQLHFLPEGLHCRITALLPGDGKLAAKR